MSLLLNQLLLTQAGKPSAVVVLTEADCDTSLVWTPHTAPRPRGCEVRCGVSRMFKPLTRRSSGIKRELQWLGPLIAVLYSNQDL